MTVSPVEPPPEAFNFAAHLLEANAGRVAKAAFIDDIGVLTYGELDERARRFAAALRERGVKREERALILMQDCAEWPVAFLGAMLAGIVPVAVNTLLTADDLAYMLEHSRAQAVLVSGAVKPSLKAALAKADHEVHTVVVSRPAQPLEPGEIEFGATSSAARRRSRRLRTRGPTIPRSGSTRRVRPAGRKARCIHTPTRIGRPSFMAKRSLGLTENDVCFSAAKLFFAYGLGNALTFPLAVGATALLMAERPTPEAVFKRLSGGVGGVKPTIFYGAPTGFAGMLASNLLPKREELALRLASSAGEALPAEIGERFKRHFGVDIVDGIGSTEMLHIFISNRPDKVRYGSTGWPVPGYDIELRGEDGRPVPDGEPGDLYIHGPSAALMYWGNRAKTRETFEGRWTRSGDKYMRNADGSYTYAGRADDMLKVGGIWVSPFEVEATLMQHPSVLEAAVIGAPDADGLIKSKAFVVLKEGASADEVGASALRQGSPRAIQVSALNRLHRRTAEDGDRQDPTLPAAGAGAGVGQRLSKPLPLSAL